MILVSNVQIFKKRGHENAYANKVIYVLVGLKNALLFTHLI